MRLCRRGLPGRVPPLLPECWGLRTPRVAGAGIVVGPANSDPEQVEEMEERALAVFIVFLVLVSWLWIQVWVYPQMIEIVENNQKKVAVVSLFVFWIPCLLGFKSETCPSRDIREPRP